LSLAPFAKQKESGRQQTNEGETRARSAQYASPIILSLNPVRAPDLHFTDTRRPRERAIALNVGAYATFRLVNRS